MSIRVKKAKLTKGRTLEVTMTEYMLVNEQQVQNDVAKKCDYLVHNDLLEALEALAPHMVNICELNCNSSEVKITGFTLADGAEGEGVIIIGQKTLSTGKILNIVSPLIEFYNGEYSLERELNDATYELVHEVELYVNEGKSAVKQTSLNFDEDDETAEINIGTTEEPKKRGRKKKATLTIMAGGENFEMAKMDDAV